MGIPSALKLEIVTPHRLVFAGEVEVVTVPGAEGALGILPGHAALLSELKIGVISYRQGGSETRLYCGWGFVEVLSDQVSVLAEEIEFKNEINVPEAEQERLRAMELLKSKDPHTNYVEAVHMLAAAVTRLEVARG